MMNEHTTLKSQSHLIHIINDKQQSVISPFYVIKGLFDHLCLLKDKVC